MRWWRAAPVFERHGAPLMVTECFLPALWAHVAALSKREREVRPDLNATDAAARD